MVRAVIVSIIELDVALVCRLYERSHNIYHFTNPRLKFLFIFFCHSVAHSIMMNERQRWWLQMSTMMMSTGTKKKINLKVWIKYKRLNASQNSHLCTLYRSHKYSCRYAIIGTLETLRAESTQHEKKEREREAQRATHKTVTHTSTNLFFSCSYTQKLSLCCDCSF